MLRKHEIDLIAGLVEGSLEDESAVRALIERSEEARAEYEAQRTAYEALRSAEPVAMSESEKAALHRDLWTALQQDPQPAKKTPWYYKVVPVAAALFVIVGLGAVLTQGVLNQQSGDEAATAETFTEAAEGLSRQSTSGDGERSDTVETTAAASADADDNGGADLAAEEAAPLSPALVTAFTEIAEAVRTTGALDDETRFRFLGEPEELEKAAQCLESAGLPDYLIVGEFEDPPESETTYLVVVQSDDDIGPGTQVVFIDTANCQIAHVED